MWLRWNSDKLFVAIVVRDDVHRLQVGSALAMWQGDCVQYGFDAGGNAPVTRPDGWDPRDDSEWEIGLFEGASTLVRYTGPRGTRPGLVAGTDRSGPSSRRGTAEQGGERRPENVCTDPWRLFTDRAAAWSPDDK